MGAILTNAVNNINSFAYSVGGILLVIGLFVLKNWLYRRKVKRAAKIFAKEMSKSLQAGENAKR